MNVYPSRWCWASHLQHVFPKWPKFQRHSKYSFQNQVLSQMHLRPILRCPVQSSLPPSLENTSLGLSPIFHWSSLKIGHQDPWVPGWDAQIILTADRNPRDKIQGSCHHCLVILQLATSKQESLKKYHHQMNWSICSSVDPQLVQPDKNNVMAQTERDLHSVKHYEIHVGFTPFSEGQCSLSSSSEQNWT